MLEMRGSSSIGSTGLLNQQQSVSAYSHTCAFCESIGTPTNCVDLRATISGRNSSIAKFAPRIAAKSSVEQAAFLRAGRQERLLPEPSLPDYFEGIFAPAVMAIFRWFCPGGRGHVVNVLYAQGGL